MLNILILWASNGSKWKMMGWIKTSSVIKNYSEKL